jgi:tetratricopeptide (TPR) repeat protein
MATIGGGFMGGLKLREQRVLRQVTQVQADAKALASTDTYLGYKQARDLYGRIDQFQGDDSSQSAFARSEAALAAEFGHSPGTGAALLAEVGDKSGLDSLVAGAYIAIAKGDHGEAAEKATLITESYADAAIGHYLLGRAKILAEDPEAALVSIDKALKLGASPLVYVAQARAEALQGRYSEALSAVAQAIEGEVANAAGVIWQARILLQSGELPKNPSDPDDLLKELIERSRSRELNAKSLSPAQGAWAGLVLAEIKLHRGDNAEADKVLAEAKVNRPSDWLFSEMLADILIRLGKNKEAGAEATKASETWPGRAKPRITLALVALLDGDPEGAIEILDGLDEVESLAEALIVRGRANLTLGLLDKAVSDLDKALEMRSRDSDAIIARAKVDIMRGDAKAAIGRLEPMYDRTAGPNLAIAYATALRTRGKLTQARSVLDPLVGEDGSAAALIELAALEQSEGNFVQARAAFKRAIAVDPGSQDARLGAALLDIEDGKINAGRKGLEALVAEGTENGQILVEAARARTWTGDSESARILLERTSKASSWLNWKVARESGRINLRRQNLDDAIVDLLRASGLRPTDPDTRLLLMEAYLVARNKKGAQSTLEDIAKSFPDSPVRSIAAGMLALLQDKPTEAAAAFEMARLKLIDLNASNLQQGRVAYWLGRAMEVSGDLGGATGWFERAIGFNEADAAAYFYMGQVQIRDGKTKKMVASYKKAMDIDPGYNPIAWYFLGSQYASEKKNDLAAKALESFLQHYPEKTGDLVIDAKALLEQVR